MADFSTLNWSNRSGDNTGKPRISAANLNRLEAGVLDAATHHKQGTLAARPAAAPANKNWLYFITDLGFWSLSDGANWIALGGGTAWTQPGAFDGTSSPTTRGKLGGVAGTGAWIQSRANYDGNDEYFAWRKDQFNRVHLKGVLAWNSAGNSGGSPVVARLPVGFAPNRRRRFVCYSNIGGTSNSQPVIVEVYGEAASLGSVASSGGNIYVYWSTGIAGAGTRIDFSGISFDASDGTEA